MAKRVTVLTIPSANLINEAGQDADALLTTKATLRALRPFGVRFSTEAVDFGDTTVVAWIEDREPRQPKERKALGAVSVPPIGGGLDE